MPERTVAKKVAKKVVKKKAVQKNVKKKAKIKNLDYGALLFVSVLLHSLLALLPWPEESRPPAEPISAIPIPVVSASQLPSLPTPEPQPLPVIPAPIPSPPAIASSPQAAPTDLILGTSANEANTVEANAIEERGDPTADPTPAGTPAPGNISTNASANGGSNSGTEGNNGNEGDTGEPTNDGDSANGGNNAGNGGDEAAIAAAWESFTSSLQGQSDEIGFNLLEIFEIFGEPEQVNQFFNENNQPRLEVSSYYFFPGRTPKGVVDEIIDPELSDQTDFELQPPQTFSSGLTYQISQGEAFYYLTIVEFNDGESNESSDSVLIISDSLPPL